MTTAETQLQIELFDELARTRAEIEALARADTICRHSRKYVCMQLLSTPDLTQTEIAQAAGVNRRTIIRWNKERLADINPPRR